MAYAVHQCARFSTDPKQSHSKAVMYLVKYLKRARKMGLVLKPEPTKSLKFNIDAVFWELEQVDITTIYKHCEIQVMFACCQTT